jgi:hypothetical protein
MDRHGDAGEADRGHIERAELDRSGRVTGSGGEHDGAEARNHE